MKSVLHQRNPLDQKSLVIVETCNARLVSEDLDSLSSRLSLAWKKFLKSVKRCQQPGDLIRYYILISNKYNHLSLTVSLFNSFHHFN